MRWNVVGFSGEVRTAAWDRRLVPLSRAHTLWRSDWWDMFCGNVMST